MKTELEIKTAIERIKKRELWQYGLSYSRLALEWVLGDSEFEPWNGDEEESDSDITVDDIGRGN